MNKTLESLISENKIKETAIGLLLSYGGFSAFLPNLLKSVSTVNGTTTFDALTWFAILYFLLPCFIFLTYWSFHGSKRKYPDYQDGKSIDLTSKSHRCEWIFFGLRLLPFLLFFFNRFFFHSGFFRESSLTIFSIWFTAIGLVEFWFFGKRACKKLKGIVFLNDRTISVLKQGAIVSLLNPVLGIGFLYLSEPWFLYKDYMILILWAVISVYVLFVYWIFELIVRTEKLEFNSLNFVFVPYLIALGLVYLMPHVNRSMGIFSAGKFFSQTFIDFFCLIGVLVFAFLVFSLISYKAPRRPKQITEFLLAKASKTPVPHWILIIVFLSLPFLFNSFIEHENRTYFGRRINATEKISNKKLIPSLKNENDGFDTTQIQLLKFVHRNNHFIRSHGNWENTNKSGNVAITELFDLSKPETFNLLFDSLAQMIFDISIDQSESNKHDSSAIVKMIDSKLGKLVRLREFYYEKYDTIYRNKETLDTIGQQKVNEFYSSLFIHLKNSVFQNTIIPLSGIDSLRPISRYYLHPLNYYSHVVTHYEEQLELVQGIHTKIRHIASLDKFKKQANGSQIYDPNALSFKMKELIESVNKKLPEIIEIKGSGFLLKDNSDKDNLNFETIEKSFKAFLTYKENQKNERIKNAQVIYQSYLYDYQRIGIFLFLLQLTIFGSLYYTNRVDEKTKKSDLDSALIALITVAAMLLPLLKVIEAENIDPRKKYWMLNLANWYSPALVFPEPPPLKEEEQAKSKNGAFQIDSSTFFIVNQRGEMETVDLGKVESSLESILTELGNIDSTLKNQNQVNLEETNRIIKDINNRLNK